MQTRTDTVKRLETYFFNSLSEFGAWINATPKKWRGDKATSVAATAHWDLCAGYDGAVSMARDGWLDGASKAQAALKEFTPSTAAPNTRIDFYGHMPHVPRFCAGAPDNMIRHDRNATMGSGKVLTIAVGLDANAGVSAQHMANFGVAVAQYINQLETHGTRVHVLGALIGNLHRSSWRLAHIVTIKSADQPLDLAVMAFAIGHPAMLRRLGLAAIERSNAPEQPGYGRAEDPRISDIINAPPGTVILSGMKDANLHAKTPEAALEYITKQIDAAIAAQELEQ